MVIDKYLKKYLYRIKKKSKKSIKINVPIMRMLLPSNGKKDYNLDNKFIWDNNGKLKKNTNHKLFRKKKTKKKFGT